MQGERLKDEGVKDERVQYERVQSEGVKDERVQYKGVNAGPGCSERYCRS